MQLSPIRVEFDEEPEFNIDDFDLQKQVISEQKDQKDSMDKNKLKQRQVLNASKLSDFGKSNRSLASSMLDSPAKNNSITLRKKNSNFQSISPDKKHAKGNFAINRPLFSANIKNKKVFSTIKGEAMFERTSYSPSPQRKSLYWQSWMLPLNQTMRDKSTQPPPKISAVSYIAMMADSLQVMASQNCNAEKQIASLTKIMTAYTVLSICSNFGVKIRQHYVPINKQAAFMIGTSAGLKQDQEILIIDLLYALLLPSGNDAGIALSQFFGKFLSYKFAQEGDTNEKMKTSMERFKQFKDFYDSEYEKESINLFLFQMNKNCHKIGLKNTHFNNPTGLSDPKNYSTAKDIAILTSHCLKNHTLRTMFKKKFHSCEVKNEKLANVRQIQWKNTNRHLFQFKECIGIKTGITPNAGPCLSSAYKMMGRQLIIILIECQSLQARYQDSQKLFKWCRKKVRAF